MIVIGGVTAGLISAALSLLVEVVQRVAYGTHSSTLLQEVLDASPLRRILVPTIGGLLVGFVWWGLRHTSNPGDVEEALETGKPIGVWKALGDAVTQIVAVAMGASIGREGAPRQASAAITDWLSRRMTLGRPESRALIAAAAGAGLASVYNVPLAGVVFVMDILLGWASWRAIAIALPMSAIATVVAWPVVTNNPIYDFPRVAFQWDYLLWAVAAVPATALVGLVFARMANWAVQHRPKPGWQLPVAMTLAGAIVGTCSVWLPMLPGNGMDSTQWTFDGNASIGIFVALLLLKPLVTSICLGSGMKGGLLTPAISVGAMLGGLVAVALPGAADVPIYALIGAAGLLAVTQKAPYFGAVMVWELTRAPLWTLPVLIAVGLGAHLVATSVAPGVQAMSMRVRRPRNRTIPRR